MPKTLVLDNHLSSKTLIAGLVGRGLAVVTIEYGLEIPGDAFDSEVARRADERLGAGNCVLVTIDGTIIEDSPGFDWGRYALAWIKTNPDRKGAAVEEAKHGILHKRADVIVAQGPGDHFTYTEGSFYRHPPSLMSRPY